MNTYNMRPNFLIAIFAGGICNGDLYFLYRDFCNDDHIFVIEILAMAIYIFNSDFCSIDS